MGGDYMTTKLKTPDIDLIELSGKWVYQHPSIIQLTNPREIKKCCGRFAILFRRKDIDVSLAKI